MKAKEIKDFVKNQGERLDNLWNKSVDDTNTVPQCLRLYTSRLLDKFMSKKPTLLDWIGDNDNIEYLKASKDMIDARIKDLTKANTDGTE